jgi:DNA-binding transcriptional LysR family regulator
MDLPSLRMFQAVAEARSVTRAAERLHCVQSNVTARVLGLERELGVKLFQRQPRGMVPTPAGNVLLGYTRRLLALAEEAGRAAREAEGNGGPFTLGSMETTAAVRLPGALAALQRELPRATVTLRTGPSRDLVREVLAGQVDAALVAGQVDHPDLASERLYSETLVAVTTRARRRLRPLGEPVLLAFRSGCSYRARAEEWLRREGSPSFQVMELGTLEGILGCVAAGMGLTVLPRAVVERPAYRGGIRAHPLPPELAEAPTCLVRRRDAHPLRAVAALAEILRRQD